MFKKIAVFALALMLLASALAFAEETTQIIALGTSGLTMEADASYQVGEITAEDTEDSQVAYYFSETYALDFDVYQWAKAEGETLLDAGNEEAEEYGATLTETEFNGVPAVYYETVEEYDGKEYPTVTFIMENGDVFAEIVFWMDGDNAGDLVEGMVNTITAEDDGVIAAEGNVISLGTSSLKITTPCLFTEESITAEDTEDSQVGYYASEETLVDFDVYQWAKAEGETLADAAGEEAADHGAEVQELQVGDIALVYYNAVEEYDDAQYNTVTYIAEDGNDFVEIVFWLDGENAQEMVDQIIGSISR